VKEGFYLAPLRTVVEARRDPRVRLIGPDSVGCLHPEVIGPVPHLACRVLGIFPSHQHGRRILTRADASNDRTTTRVQKAVHELCFGRVKEFN